MSVVARRDAEARMLTTAASSPMPTRTEGDGGALDFRILSIRPNSPRSDSFINIFYRGDAETRRKTGMARLGDFRLKIIRSSQRLRVSAVSDLTSDSCLLTASLSMRRP